MSHKLTRQYHLLFALIALILMASSCLAGPAPKNIILLIGDGMGIGHVTAARCADPDGKLNMDTMPITGFAITHAANALVTDSAAAGTALATGVKTTNGTISQDPDGKRLRTLLEAARDMGKSTSIVSTTSIVDATPAVFVAHAANRGMKEDIAAQLVASRVDVAFGDGKSNFLPESAGGNRKDGRDLLEDAKKRGYAVVDTADALAKTESYKMIGLFDLNAPSAPTIADMTAKALSILSTNPKGFFVMSEGAKIDSYSHGKDAKSMVREALNFDDAIKVALDFAKKNTDTLVVVTADHETGGCAVYGGDEANPKYTANYLSGGHSANMVPIYAFGPGAELFSGTHDNTEIPKICARLWKQQLN